MIRIKLLLFIFFISIFNNCVAQDRHQKLTDFNFGKFYWAADSINGRYMDKAAMYIPLQIDTIKGNYFAQFDLGSNGSVLYENNAKTIFNAHPQLRMRIDSMKGAKSDDGKALFKIDRLR
jgi:hypothetical protein